MPQGGVKQVARCNDRVHERIGIGFFSDARSQMKDERHVLACNLAILAGQEIAFDYPDSLAVTAPFTNGLEAGVYARWSREAEQVAKPTLQQTRDNLASDETACPGHQDWVIGSDNEFCTSHLSHNFIATQ